MRTKKLKQVAKFLPGINPTRAEKQYGGIDINYYDQASFEEDYHYQEDGEEMDDFPLPSLDLALKEGDVVISTSMQQAAIVRKGNAGKVPSINFIKVELEEDEMDRGFFLYLFNSCKIMRKQKERELQGTGTSQRIPLKSLEQLVIPHISMEEQKKIGEIYNEMLGLQSKLYKYTKLIGTFTEGVIEENLKEAWEDERL